MRLKSTVSKKEQASPSNGIGPMITIEELLVPATRYYLGRSTIAAVCHAEALARHWYDLSENARVTLRRDIEEAIQHDDAVRARAGANTEETCPHASEDEDGRRASASLPVFYPLGQDCDRAAWCKVRTAWLNPPKHSKPVSETSSDAESRSWHNGDT